MHDTGFQEVADRVWVARYAWWDVNIGLIAGADGLLLVDTHASAVAARQVAEDVRRLGVGPVTGLVNTHAHFDHTFGNDALRSAFGPVPIHATAEAAETTVAAGERMKDQLRSGEEHDERAEEILATAIVPADHTFSSVAVVELGDRLVELVHPGRGHTGGDLVVRVPDADVLLAGDLVEESGPPGIGPDSFLAEWPATLEVVVRMLTASSVVVPGHGRPVDRAFVLEQHAELARLALDAQAPPPGPTMLPLA
ncbi:MAG TPA: MBL fold metallo-hydrolase [Nocardioides sp.]|uniref:MBL fold metallo-hydrolase n=1 Tax=Nocardioides sp. TaxID=35761 RepID=UPI002EDA1238